MNDHWAKLSQIKREIDNNITDMQKISSISNSDLSKPQSDLEKEILEKLKLLSLRKGEISTKISNFSSSLFELRNSSTESDLSGFNGK